jgi:radical SAM protein with 4Fe4S-binding SPASM domain
VLRYIDNENHFVEMFNSDTGFYIRSGIIENGVDTGIDPFMRNFPQLIDIGIMNRCVCANKCKVDCYQKAIERTGENMSLRNYIRIMEECKGKVFQVALGGAGDVDTHENFEEILRITRENKIVPNFTTSGLTMTKEKAAICKQYCGAIAVSEHFADYTNNAIDMLLDAGVKTNIHYVLSNKTIDNAIYKLKNNAFKKGINSVVFLLYKPIGLGKIENVLSVNDDKVKEFFTLVDTAKVNHKIGFDSCSVAGIINYTKEIDKSSVDTCEGSRYSMYITADMKALPCSFDNQDLRFAYDIFNDTILNAWNSEVFINFRDSLRYSCSGCRDKVDCRGGCPLRQEIVLCNRKERNHQCQRYE